MAEFKDFAVTGEYIVALPEAERWFELIDEPVYKKEEKENEKNEELLIFPVKLSNGTTGKYYPNATSARKVATLNKSTDMTTWKSKKYYWGFMEKRKCFGAVRDIMYITDFYPPTEKPNEG